MRCRGQSQSAQFVGFVTLRLAWSGKRQFSIGIRLGELRALRGEHGPFQVFVVLFFQSLVILLGGGELLGLPFAVSAAPGLVSAALDPLALGAGPCRYSRSCEKHGAETQNTTGCRAQPDQDAGFAGSASDR